MADLEVQALEARSRRQFDKLEEKVEKRQYLEARLLEAERMFREEKLARKEAEENFEETTRRLNDATNQELATALYIDALDDNGDDISDFINAIINNVLVKTSSCVHIVPIRIL